MELVVGVLALVEIASGVVRDSSALFEVVGVLASVGFSVGKADGSTVPVVGLEAARVDLDAGPHQDSVPLSQVAAAYIGKLPEVEVRRSGDSDELAVAQANRYGLLFLDHYPHLAALFHHQLQNPNYNLLLLSH